MAETETTTVDTPAPSNVTVTPPPPPPPDDELGDGGKKALDTERKARRDAEKLLKDQLVELDKLREATQTEQEKAVAEATKKAVSEAVGSANARILRAEVKAAAAGKLADPADAVAMLDLGDFTVTDDGDVDGKAIAKAIDELVEAKPYLGVEQRPTAVPTGTRQPDAPDPGPGKDRLVAAFADQDNKK